MEGPLAVVRSLLESVALSGERGKGSEGKSHGPPLLSPSPPRRGRGGEKRGAVTRLPVLSVDHGEDVVLGHDEVLLAIDRHLVAGIGTEQDAVALVDLKGGTLAVVHQLALAQAEHLA